MLWWNTPSGAMLQNTGRRKTSRTPTVAARRPEDSPSPPAFGSRGTRRNRTTALRSSRTARRRNSSRQLTRPSIHSVGVVAASAPVDPTAMTNPFRNGSRDGGAQSTKALNDAIRHAATPSPVRKRPTSRIGNESATPNRRQPAAAATSSTPLVRRGPRWSSAPPIGNWDTAKASR